MGYYRNQFGNDFNERKDISLFSDDEIEQYMIDEANTNLREEEELEFDDE